jgi:hypothetical protein
MLINKTFHQILFILSMSDIGFVPFPDLELQFKILILVFLISNLNLKLPKFYIGVT